MSEEFKVVRALFEPVLDCKGSPSRTRVEFQYDADMDNIIRKFLKTGLLNQPNFNRPIVDGLESPGDFHDAVTMAFEERQSQIQFEEKNEANISTEHSQHGVEDGIQPVSKGASASGEGSESGDASKHVD